MSDLIKRAYRLSGEHDRKIKELKKDMEISESGVLREGIDRLYRSVKRKKKFSTVTKKK